MSFRFFISNSFLSACILLLFHITTIAQEITYTLVQSKIIETDIRGIKEQFKITFYKSSDGHQHAMAVPTVAPYAGDDLVKRASAPNLTTDIVWDEDPNTVGVQITFSGVAAAQAAFNNARRGEESQLGLSVNTLGTLSSYSGSSDDIVLAIQNDERSDRDGVLYGSNTVVVKPYEDYEYNLDTLASHHAYDLMNNNLFSHTGSDGNSPFDRITNNPVYGSSCKDFIPRAENIAIFFTSASVNPMVEERSLYNFIYEDSSSSWGHREASLLGDQALNNQGGYTDNYGLANHTGFIGFETVGINGGVYNPFGLGPWLDRTDVAVMKVVDPKGGCSYNPSVNGISVLPVTYVDFTVKTSSKGNEISFSTYEQNVSHHEVMFTYNGSSWSKLETIKAANNTGKSQYTMLHRDFAPSIQYKIQSIDYDGSIDHSDIVLVTRSHHKNPKIIIYPNPTIDGFNIELDIESDNTELTYELLDIMGKVVQKTSFYDSYYVDMKAFPKGSYIVKVYGANEELINVNRITKMQ